MPWSRPSYAVHLTKGTSLLGSVRAEVTKRGAPHSDDFKGRALWADHKHALVTPTGAVVAKCAWCERIRDVTRDLDVEHYRPKVEVTRWEGDPPEVLDRPPPQVEVSAGYWWLAFEWSNWSLSCKGCNQAWKRNLFPVESPRPAYGEGVELTERPLLLDPASNFEPRDHFRWTIDGHILSVSPHGRSTIITCGLNREELVPARRSRALEVNALLTDVVDAARGGSAAGLREALAELATLGARTAEFTGMVRWFTEERLRRRWGSIRGLPP